MSPSVPPPRPPRRAAPAAPAAARRSARTPAAATRAREACATRLVELVPLWMREVRAQMRAAAPPGLSVPLFRALIFSRSRPGASVSELAAHLGVTLPTASVTIDKLVEQGLLQSLDAPGSRRTRALHLTPAGQQAVGRAWKHTTEVVARRLEGLGSADIERIRHALDLLEPRLIDDLDDKTTS
jgi:DNA-binding MarR family transcriptional regulator